MNDFFKIINVVFAIFYFLTFISLLSISITRPHSNSKYSSLYEKSITYIMLGCLFIGIDSMMRYFNYKDIISNTISYKTIMLCSCSIILMISIIIIFLLHRKRNNKKIEKVEYDFLDEFDAAEIGYIYKNMNNKNLTVSLIIELACKKFIRIDNNKDIIVISKNITDLDKRISRKVVVKKVKELKTDLFDISLSSYNLYIKYFKDNDLVTIEEGFDEFFDKSKSLLEQGVIEIVNDTINDYSSDELDNIKNKIKEEDNKNMSKMTSNELIVYKNLFENSDSVILEKEHKFCRVFNEVEDNISNCLDDKIYDLETYKYRVFCSLLFMINVFVFIISINVMNEANTIYIVFYLSIFISLVFTLFMKNLSNYGESIRNKIKSLIKNIKLGDSDEIDKRLAKDNNYFYNILAYSYVLGVSYKWINNFKGREIIVYDDMGNFNYSSYSSLKYLNSSIYNPSDD